MLVYGGTFHAGEGNSAKEDAQDLPPCDLNAVRIFEDGLNRCTTLKELRLVLEYLASENMNIVGSRGYVYSSKLLSNLVERVHVREATLFPRTSGLRRTFINLSAPNNL